MGVNIFARNGRHQQLAAHLIANQQHRRCLVPSPETAFAMKERQERLALRASPRGLRRLIIIVVIAQSSGRGGAPVPAARGEACLAPQGWQTASQHRVSRRSCKVVLRT